MIRVVLPAHLRTLAHVDGEVELDVEGQVTQRSVLDALEARYPMLRGTIRDHVTQQRRPFVRFFACEQDLSHEPPDAPLPDAVAIGGRAVSGRGGHRRRLGIRSRRGHRSRQSRQGHRSRQSHRSHRSHRSRQGRQGRQSHRSRRSHRSHRSSEKLLNGDGQRADGYRLLEQGHPDATNGSADDLAGGGLLIEDAAVVDRRHDARDPHETQIGVDVNLGELGREDAGVGTRILAARTRAVCG